MLPEQPIRYTDTSGHVSKEFETVVAFIKAKEAAKSTNPVLSKETVSTWSAEALKATLQLMV